MIRPILGLSFASSLVLLAACSAAPPSEDVDSVRGAERWDSRNNPAFIDSTFVYEVDRLPLEGATKIAPTPADYWPTYKDSVNVRWDGDEPSPAEKYEKAFEKPGLALELSRLSGIRGQTHRKECETSDACGDLKDGSQCAIPRGETKGRCIPTWWGICPGWSAASYMELPPRKAVVRNGVTFYPGDLEALMALAYDKARGPVKFIGGRCNIEELPTDATGRVTASECRDLNPGALHVILANKLGLRNEGFVVERTASLQVWNQPGRAYRVTNAKDGKLVEITKNEAVALLGADFDYAPIQAEVTLKKDESKTGEWTAKDAGPVILRSNGTGDAELFVKRGDGASKDAFDCKSTRGGSNEECRLDVTAGEKLTWALVGFAEESKVALSAGTQIANPEYKLNAGAKRFFHVVLGLDWIREARPARESHIDQIDAFTSTDTMEYILETDEGGRIEGGEYLGSSRTAHPDFIWWPTTRPRGRVGGTELLYEDLRQMNEEAAKQDEPPPPPP